MLSYHRSVAIVIAGLLASAAVFGGDDRPGLQSGGLAWGPGIYRDHVWASVATTVVNPTDRPVELLVATSFNKTSHLQFATPVWLPPFSKHRIVQPVRLFDVPHDEGFVSETATTLLLDTAVVPEQRLDVYDSLISLNLRFPIIVCLSDPDGADALAERMTAFGASVGRVDESKPLPTGRVQRIQHKVIRAVEAPAFAGGWDAVDCVAVCQDDPPLDPAQIAALRHWLVAGGRLWLQMDQVSPAFCARLLGEDFACQIVDYVELDRVEITPQSHGRPGVLEFEKPVKMARLLAPGYEVVHRVNGWPASLYRPVGSGRVLLTAVGARVWVTERGEPLESLWALSDLFMDVSYRRPSAEEPLREVVDWHIGHEVLGRGVVLTVFVIMTLCLAAAGLWLGRRGRLERIGVVCIGLSLTAAGVLFVLGLANCGKVPTTVADAQLVRITPSQRTATVSGVMGFYTPPPWSEPMPLEAADGGLVWPDPDLIRGEQVRMVWTDLDRWYWQQPDLNPSGTRLARLEQTIALAEPVSAQLAFGPEQMDGRIEPGPLRNLGDSVLATPNGHLVPRAIGGNRFTIPRDQNPAVGQFSVGYLSLTDLQARRQSVLRQLAIDSRSPVAVRFSPTPMLLAWADGIDLGITATGNAQRYSSAIVTIPVELLRPEPGSVVRVPAAFIPYDVRDPRGKLKGAPYDSRRHSWVDMNNTDKRFVLRFLLPDVVVPFEVTEAKLTVTIDADGWRLELLDPFSEASKPLTEAINPMGEVTFDLADHSEPFRSAASGEVYLRFRVLRNGSARRSTVWSITEMALEVAGRVESAE